MNPPFSREDERWMRRALDLASRGFTTPNPMVGCVLIKHGAVISEGYHHVSGAPHAEANALARAGTNARGSTAYVTLEPCAHFGRTPPCARALIEAGVERVIAAVEDPDERVKGKGAAELRAAGISVEFRLMEEEARSLNADYFHHKLTGRPYVTLKSAMSLDGKIATRTGDSRWISSDDSRKYVHRLRARAGAVLCGIGTVLKDDPMLTARFRGAPRQPLRVILDTNLRTPLNSFLAKSARDVETIIVTGSYPNREQARAFGKLGVEIMPILADNQGHICLDSLLETLGKRGVVSVLVEGGGEVHASFLEGRHANRFVWFIAPKLIGGVNAPTPVEGSGVESVCDAIGLRKMNVRKLGGDMVVDGILDYGSTDKR